MAAFEGKLSKIISYFVRFFMLLLCCGIFALVWFNHSSINSYFKKISSDQEHPQTLATLQNMQMSIVQLSETTSRLEAQQKIFAEQLNSSFWIREEIAYMIHQANYQLILNQNPMSSLKLLIAADQRLGLLDDSKLAALRQLIATNVLALRAVKPVDMGGLIARLTALAEDIPKLQIVKPTPAVNTVAASTPSANSISLWQTFLIKLRDSLRHLIIIRHLDQPLIPLLTPTQQIQLNQDILSLLQQAQWAVLHKNQTVYVLSLQSVDKLLAQYFMLNQVETQTVKTELTALLAINIAPSLPDLTSTVLTADQLLQPSNLENSVREN